MANRTSKDSAWRNGFERTGPGSQEFFEHKIGQFMRRPFYDERSERFTRSSMREDKQKAIDAHTLSAEIYAAVHKFIDRKDGNLQDAYEILAAHIGERAFVKLAREKYGLSGDPLD